ncbi:antitoxin VapB family protein [Panacagrimonas sp.]|uniref:antitoxin VapB family protein n=1 Tax=Panacagrimonas sp. TaxID=2480088 RepID=UPI003B51F891
MKTITLTEDAYERLAALKTSPRDSFSKVILRVVPKRGTAAEILAAVRELPPLTDEQARLMDEATADLRDPSNWRDPWATS